MVTEFSAALDYRPELVMFDLDGTLVDSVPDLSAALDEMLLEQGYPPAGEYKARLWVGNGSPVLVQRALADALRVPEGEVNPALQQRCLNSFLRAYQHFNGRSSALYSGVDEGLRALREQAIPAVVITNKPARFVPALLRELDIEQYFDDYLGGDSLARRKPHPAPLQHFLRSRGVAPARALMVGDSVNDIEAARAAQVPCLAVAYGYNRGRPVELDRPDWLTDHLGDFFRRALPPAAG